MPSTWAPTTEQDAVIRFGEGPLLVLAGPGSGKTWVLTQRIIRLLRESPEETFRILALTFTNEAAKHMLEGVRDEIGEAWRRTSITTFHAFALDVLQRHGQHIGLPPNLTIFERLEDRTALLARALEYEFTGASNRYLNFFRRDFNADKKFLTVNFRSEPQIVEVANRLIQHDKTRRQRPPVKAYRRDEGDAVHYGEFPDEQTEAEWVVDGVQSLFGTPAENRPDYTLKWGDMAVLARNRYLVNAVKEGLERRDIPVILRTAEEDLLASMDGKLFYLALRILHNAADLFHLEELAVGIGVGEKEIAEILDSGTQNAATLFDVLSQRAKRPPWPTLLIFLAPMTEPGGRMRLGNLLFEGTKLLKEGMAEADRELIQLDSEFLQSQFDRLRATFPEGEPDLANYLANLALSTGRVKNDDGVRLLTVHAAKGLEFEVVWVVGLNQGSFPDYRSLSSEESLAEERRAAYVAVTRAGQRLFLSRPCRRKMPWGEEKSQQRSQFLGEMGLLAAVMSKPLGVAEKVEEYVIPE